MAHYALLDEDNIVVQVIVGKDENPEIDWEQIYGEFHNLKCLRTSYNTHGGIHYNPLTGEPSEDQTKAFRKNYAGIGMEYDYLRDAFIPIKIYESWVLNEETCTWDPPFPQPNDGKCYMWNEEIINWEETKCPDPNEGDPFGGPKEG